MMIQRMSYMCLILCLWKLFFVYMSFGEQFVMLSSQCYNDVCMWTYAINSNATSYSAQWWEINNVLPLRVLVLVPYCLPPIAIELYDWPWPPLQRSNSLSVHKQWPLRLSPKLPIYTGLVQDLMKIQFTRFLVDKFRFVFINVERFEQNVETLTLYTEQIEFTTCKRPTYF